MLSCMMIRNATLSALALLAVAGCSQSVEGDIDDNVILGEGGNVETEARALMPHAGTIAVGTVKLSKWTLSLPKDSAAPVVQKTIVDGACAYAVGYALDTAAYYPEYNVFVRRGVAKGRASGDCPNQGYIVIGMSYAVPSTDIAWKPSSPSTGQYVASFTKMSTPLCDPILDLPVVAFNHHGVVTRHAKVRATGEGAEIVSGALAVMPGSGSVHVTGTKIGTIAGEIVPEGAVPPLDGSHYEAHFDTLFGAGANDPAPDYVAGW